ncbi:MAG: immunoglobulin domain-containing protein, partial [Verrucomicrobiota bacterium]
DVSFNPVLPEGSVVAAVEVQANGKILLGGDFESVNGVSIDSTARLNADGSLDSSFNQSASLSGTVNALVVQNDGKVIAGGEFQVQGQAQLHIARLIGSEGPVAPIRAVITIQPADARVEAGADVTLTVAASSNTELSYRWLRNGVTIENETSATLSLEAVAQADAGDYSVEVSNAAGATVSETATVTVVASGAPRIVLQPVSATVVAGANVSFNVTATGEGTLNFQWRRNGVNLEGKTSATLTLEAVTTADAGDYTVVVSNNAGAEVSAEATLTVVATLNPGDLDLTFPPVQLTKVLDVEVQSDGKLVVSGDFSAAAGNSIARFNGNGSADLSFNTGLGANGPVLDAEVQADGKVIVAGEFTRFNLREHRFLVRLNADGSIDASFNVNPPPNAPVTDVEIQADGKVVIVGEFSSVGGQQHHHVARLNADGSVDASFSAGAGANGDIAEVDAQTGGKLVIVGSFSAVGGTARNGIARLNADGSVDASFDAKLNAGSSVTSVDVQGDGKIVITGNFNSVNGAARHNVVRLQADGSLDASFTTDVTTDGPVLDAEVQADGKIIISGSFEIVNGFSRNHVARLNADGSVDVNFRTNTTIPGEIEEVALQADGRIVAGGELFLGRLENGEGGTVIELFGSTLTGTRFEVSVRTVAGRRYALEASGSLNANAFTEVDVQNGDGSVKTLVDASATGSAKFYRVRAD